MEFYHVRSKEDLSNEPLKSMKFVLELFLSLKVSFSPNSFANNDIGNNSR
jgi:predicted membrane protein